MISEQKKMCSCGHPQSFPIPHTHDLSKRESQKYIFTINNEEGEVIHQRHLTAEQAVTILIWPSEAIEKTEPTDEPEEGSVQVERELAAKAPKEPREPKVRWPREPKACCGSTGPRHKAGCPTLTEKVGGYNFEKFDPEVGAEEPTEHVEIEADTSAIHGGSPDDELSEEQYQDMEIAMEASNFTCEAYSSEMNYSLAEVNRAFMSNSYKDYQRSRAIRSATR